MKMSKNIEWKKSSIDYSKLNEVSHADLIRIENGNNAVKSGQLKSITSKGGKATLGSGNYKHIQSMGGKIIGKRNAETGHIQSIASKGGKIGSRVQIKKGIGIHTKDENLRKEWARLGGLAVIDKLNEYKICPHCKAKSRGAGYNRWHGDNCKYKK